MHIMSDLHTHTIHSDGRWTPEELLREAKRIGIKQISITDHNTLKSIKEAKIKSREIGIDYVTGVEIDVKMIFEGETFHNHLLGYKFDENELGKFIAEIKELNKRYFDKLIDNLKTFLRKGKLSFNEPLIKLKKEIDIEKINSKLIIIDEYSRKYKKKLDAISLKSIFNEKFLGPEIIHRFIKNNLIEEPTKITDKYPTTWKKVFLENFGEIFNNVENFYKTHLETISAIRDAGGIIILAHPFLEGLFWDESKKEKYLSFLEYLVNNGLMGLEIYYYSNDRYTKEEQKLLNDRAKFLCKKYGLMSTYGSDCHGWKIFLGKFGGDEIISF